MVGHHPIAGLRGASIGARPRFRTKRGMRIGAIAGSRVFQDGPPRLGPSGVGAGTGPFVAPWIQYQSALSTTLVRGSPRAKRRTFSTRVARCREAITGA